MIKNRFVVLLAEKSMRDGKRITVADVSRATRIDQRTLGKWANNTITRYDQNVIEALCNYFGCQVGDLIEHIP